MNPVFTLGERVLGSPVALAEVFPPAPPPNGGGGRPPGRKSKQKHNGALRSISKLVGLYSPNSLNYGTGNVATTWADTSGRRHDAPDGTVIQRYDPAISSNYVEGNGAREGFGYSLLGDHNLVPDYQQLTIYAVFRPTGSDTPFFSISESGGDTTWRLGFSSTGKIRLESTYSGLFESSKAYALNQWHYIVFIRKSSSTCEIWVDGKKDPSVAGIMVSCTPWHYHVGSGWYQIFGGYPRMVGDLAECAWWGKRVNSNERQTIESHAQYKFKL
jgi:hypothetical protein